MASRGRMYNALDSLDAIGTFFRVMRKRFGMTQEDLFLQIFDISPMFRLAYSDYMSEDEEEHKELHSRRRLLGHQLEIGAVGRMESHGPNIAFWITVYKELSAFFDIEEEWIVDRATALVTAIELDEDLIIHARRNPGENEYIAFILEVLG